MVKCTTVQNIWIGKTATIQENFDHHKKVCIIFQLRNYNSFTAGLVEKSLASHAPPCTKAVLLLGMVQARILWVDRGYGASGYSTRLPPIASILSSLKASLLRQKRFPLGRPLAAFFDFEGFLAKMFINRLF